MARIIRYLIASLLIWAVPRTTAQESAPAPPERQLSFTVFSAQPITTLCYVPQPGAVPVPMCFYPTARSPHYTYRGSPVVQFFDSATGAVMAAVSVPAWIRTALLILSVSSPPGSATVHYHVQIMDEGAARHAPGTLLVLNLSGLELTGTINRDRIVLAEGPNDPIRVGESAAITLRTPFNGRSYQAYSESIMLGPSGRALLLLLPPYRPGSLEVQSRVLLDEPPPEGAANHQ